MKGKYKAALALILLFILLPLTLLLTLAYWVPTLAGIWLPSGTRISMEESPRFTRHALHIPDLSYLIDDCPLALIKGAALTHPSRWQLDIASLDLNTTCLNKLPETASSPAAPRTLAQWQSMLPKSWVNIHRMTISPWQEWEGGVSLALSEAHQAIHYRGKRITVSANLRGQVLTIDQMQLSLLDNQPPVTLGGQFTLPLVPQGVPVNGHAQTTLTLPTAPGLVDADIEWRDNEGQLVVMARDNPDPILDLPWQATAGRLTISDGRWNWPYQGFPLSGRVGLRIDDWQKGLQNALVSGRLNVLTQGDAGKGNAVLTFGPGRPGRLNSEMPLQLTGEAKQGEMIFYAVLPATLTGGISEPQLAFTPGALLRSRGRVIDNLNIDEIRWPLAGVKVTRRGVDGRLQAILRAHENSMGDFTLHLDGRAQDFLPDAGLWQWRYWGDGHFTPMDARWDVAGRGEWRDKTIELRELSTGFDQLHYGTMRITTPRLKLHEPVRWLRDDEHPFFGGALTLDAGPTTFSGGSVLPPSTLTFSVTGSEPTLFQFKGDLHADSIGPVRVNGRWDGVRLRGQAWWPRQSLTVFQPLVPPEMKMNLLDGELYAQVAFSAAAGQGFDAGGHGVLRGGSVWMPDNQISGVDFVLPFRYHEGTWQLGTRGPVSLRIGEVVNQVIAKNIRADLQGSYPWDDAHPLQLSDVSLEVLGGKMTMRQLRLPQHDPALLRLQNMSSSELISAINPKQFTMSGRFDGALPLWLDNNHAWIIKDGWLNNPGPMTLRVDKDTVDALQRDNVAAGSVINWLRYMEISRSWTKLDLDSQGLMKMQAAISGTSVVDGKRNRVNLNYNHEENVFALWRSLRFGDNLQSLLKQNTTLPGVSCANGKVCEENQ
ncbi:YdbH family protein [Yokenella regensburgei]|uniref:YdbH family protein n=1 Tax=Yokenella regensburgei TaxID=158877 RepID=UPI003F18B38A